MVLLASKALPSSSYWTSSIQFYYFPCHRHGHEKDLCQRRRPSFSAQDDHTFGVRLVFPWEVLAVSERDINIVAL